MNVAYITDFARKVISLLKWRSPWNKNKTISKILKIVSGVENNSEGISSNYESNFLNCIEIRSENCRLTNVRVFAWVRDTKTCCSNATKYSSNSQFTFRISRFVLIFVY